VEDLDLHTGIILNISYRRCLGGIRTSG